MAVLVTGGAGYIGSAFVERARGCRRKSRRPRRPLARPSRGRSIRPPRSTRGATGDRELVARIAREHTLDACVHFAAFAYVGESVSEPGRYFDNNFTQAHRAVRDPAAPPASSVSCSPRTCATYGVPRRYRSPRATRSGRSTPTAGRSCSSSGSSDELRPRSRPALRRAALLQRLPAPTRPPRRAPRARDAPRPARAARRPPAGAGVRSSAATTTRRTARPSATTSTQRPRPRRTCWRSPPAPRRRLPVPEPRHRNGTP